MRPPIYEEKVEEVPVETPAPYEKPTESPVKLIT
jgi:hypothetical protein